MPSCGQARIAKRSPTGMEKNQPSVWRWRRFSRWRFGQKCLKPERVPATAGEGGCENFRICVWFFIYFFFLSFFIFIFIFFPSSDCGSCGQEEYRLFGWSSVPRTLLFLKPSFTDDHFDYTNMYVPVVFAKKCSTVEGEPSPLSHSGIYAWGGGVSRL